MLEQNLSTAQWTLKMVNRYFLPVWAVISIVAVLLVKEEGEGLSKGLIILGLIGVASYFYFRFKYYLQVKLLSNYVTALQQRSFGEALSFGRQYYSVKRKGFLGADGSGLTIYDEQAISNDINAYSK